MTKQEINQYLIDSFISSFYLSFKAHDTWAKVEDVHVHPDHTLGRRRMVGFYGWVLADNGREYASGVDFPLALFHHDYSPNEESGLAMQATLALIMMLEGRIEPPYPTKEALAEGREPFEDIL